MCVWNVIRIGGVWHTSWDAFQRFCERASQNEVGDNESQVENWRKCTQNYLEGTLEERGKTRRGKLPHLILIVINSKESLTTTSEIPKCAKVRNMGSSRI